MPKDEPSDDEVLYRFVSVFDLYELIFKGRLRLAKFSTFHDKNEGVGYILDFQDNALVRRRYLANDAIHKEHQLVRENHYATCWTTEPDQIAMWSLYSADEMSIRISTTAAKLKKVLHLAGGGMNWSILTATPGTRQPVSWGSAVQRVQYVDFFEIRDSIRHRFQEFRDYTSKRASEIDEYFRPGGTFYKDYTQFVKLRVVEREGVFLKDRAYLHEKEVRGILYFGVRNDLTVEEWREKWPAKGALPSALFELAKPGELDDQLFVDTPSDFVESLCFDPRMPSYKRSVYESIFSTFLGRMVKSRAFGYALVEESFASDYDGNPK